MSADYPNWEIVTLRGERYVLDQCQGCGVRYTIPEIVQRAHYDKGGFASMLTKHKNVVPLSQKTDTARLP